MQNNKQYDLKSLWLVILIRLSIFINRFFIQPCAMMVACKDKAYVKEGNGN